MIDRVIDFSVRNHFFVFLLVVAAAWAGWWLLRHAPLDAIPDLSDTQVIVFSRWDRSPDLVDLPHRPAERPASQPSRSGRGDPDRSGQAHPAEVHDRGDHLSGPRPHPVGDRHRFGRDEEIAAPMIGGIFTSFLLELVVYPAVYELWKWNFELKKELRGASLRRPGVALSRRSRNQRGPSHEGFHATTQRRYEIFSHLQLTFRG